ncbi:hypothetical protein LABF186_10340 [Lactobacillus amylovorus subsp. animalium]|uniref:DUF4767 domain-containing protein n=1 Tax=Lactobacillus amylovorus subsp. animalium TaxID=3378536 RepID=A0ABD0C3Q4_LACAM|nr:hypothetical protein LABF186_10340 [Lactobacillus amylovorus]GMM15842.1 hypothetical protein LABF125_09750 [Lactobacillus amylovorus]
MVYLTVQSGKSSNSASEVATSKNKHKGSSTSSSSLSQSSSSEESSSDDQSGKFAQSGWSSDQEAQLASFMNRFGTKMKQKYKEYNGQESIETLAGEKYPDDFNNRTFKMYSDNSKKTETINIGWDPSLKKDYDYHVVSIFNCNVGNPEQHITYLFSVHDGQPVALVDQTTNGSDCMVKETANQEVRTAFANIFEGNN